MRDQQLPVHQVSPHIDFWHLSILREYEPSFCIGTSLAKFVWKASSCTCIRSSRYMTLAWLRLYERSAVARGSGLPTYMFLTLVYLVRLWTYSWIWMLAWLRFYERSAVPYASDLSYKFLTPVSLDRLWTYTWISVQAWIRLYERPAVAHASGLPATWHWPS